MKMRIKAIVMISQLLFKKPILSLTVILFSYATSIAQTPTASFNISDSTGCTPLSISFTNASTNAISYEWDFGNGEVSTKAQPSIVYSKAGTYSIQLVAKAANGKADTLKMLNAIKVNELPVIDFTFSLNSQCLSKHVIDFTNNSSSSYSYLWDFGDGNTSTSKNPSHQYADSGIYFIKLIANDSLGCTNLKTSADSIHIVKGPQSSFNVDSRIGCDTNQLFQFNNSSSNASSYSWSFGDGESSSELNPSHQYSDTGMYSIQLISTDTNGCSDTLNKTDFISLNFPFSASFSSENSIGCTPLSSRLIGDTINNNLVHTWTFSNGDTLIGTDVTTVFNEKGLYDVKLTVIDKNGCKDSILKSNYIDAKGNAFASFYPDSLDSCSNRTVQFHNASQNGVNYLWKFGSQDSSSSYHTSYSFVQEGSYQVVLKVTDSDGCVDSTTQTYHVNGLSPDFTVPDKKGCKPFSVEFEDKSIKADKWTWYFGDGRHISPTKPYTYLPIKWIL